MTCSPSPFLRTKSEFWDRLLRDDPTLFRFRVRDEPPFGTDMLLGTSEGKSLGIVLGIKDGIELGKSDGASEGLKDGTSLGTDDGIELGVLEGISVEVGKRKK